MREIPPTRGISHPLYSINAYIFRPSPTESVREHNVVSSGGALASLATGGPCGSGGAGTGCDGKEGGLPPNAKALSSVNIV